MGRALYDRIGAGYSRYRSPDARIAKQISAALGDSRVILNVGAGTGSYEPTDRMVVAVDNSIEMFSQRAGAMAALVLGSADRLPFEDGSFDAALAVLTVHHWPDISRGLAEVRRIASDRVVILTWDPRHPGFWLVRDYFPEILELDRPLFPKIEEMEAILGSCEVLEVPVPGDCSDGFLGAYWRRPEMYLDSGVRQAISSFSKLRDPVPGLSKLQRDLDSGRWRRRNSDLLGLRELDIGYRLVVAGSLEAEAHEG